MRRVCFVTGTRAEYGLLAPLMRAVSTMPGLTTQLVVTCMHLSPAFGQTVRLIRDDGWHIDDEVEMLLASDSPTGAALSTGLGIIRLTGSLERLRPDVIVLLGDRFEALAAATAAFLLRIPIAHIHGGELTEGSLDDGMRHAITKLSLLHFTSTSAYRRRVIQMGEDPARVFAVGALGVDNIMSMPLLDRQTLEQDLGLDLGARSFLVTFNPVTIEDDSTAQLVALLEALDRIDGFVLFTRPNADPGGHALHQVLDDWVCAHADRSAIFSNLGTLRYLSAAKCVDVVVGNSSSGIIEAPALGTPVVNIGSRQNGRVRPAAVIDCAADSRQIETAILRALTAEFRLVAASELTVYGDGHAAAQIARVLASADLSTGALHKRFHDLEGDWS